jgi:hypothetical protein
MSRFFRSLSSNDAAGGSKKGATPSRPPSTPGLESLSRGSYSEGVTPEIRVSGSP